MYHETMPLYPELRPGCDGGECLRMPVFGGEGPGERLPELRCPRRVTIENPCRPGEYAEVLLGLDGCGNLVVCVRKEPDRDCCRPCPSRPRPCRPGGRPLPPPEPRCGGRGRLYGTWR